jgi:hypothetical protein
MFKKYKIENPCSVYMFSVFFKSVTTFATRYFKVGLSVCLWCGLSLATLQASGMVFGGRSLKYATFIIRVMFFLVKVPRGLVGRSRRVGEAWSPSSAPKRQPVHSAP